MSWINHIILALRFVCEKGCRSIVDFVNNVFIYLKDSHWVQIVFIAFVFALLFAVFFLVIVERNYFKRLTYKACYVKPTGFLRRTNDGLDPCKDIISIEPSNVDWSTESMFITIVTDQNDG